MVFSASDVDFPATNCSTAQRMRIPQVPHLVPRVVRGIVSMNDSGNGANDVHMRTEDDSGDAGEGMRHLTPRFPTMTGAPEIVAVDEIAGGSVGERAPEHDELVAEDGHGRRTNSYGKRCNLFV